MPYRNQAEVLDKRLTQLYESVDVSINAMRSNLHAHCNILHILKGIFSVMCTYDGTRYKLRNIQYVKKNF